MLTHAATLKIEKSMSPVLYFRTCEVFDLHKN